jgi:hypothetical protein
MRKYIAVPNLDSFAERSGRTSLQSKAISAGTAARNRIVTSVVRAALGLTAALLFSCHAAAAGLHQNNEAQPKDPLFNLPYDTAQVHFDSFSLASVAQCAPLLGNLGHGTGHTKLFGELTNGRGRVIVMGDQDPDAPRGLSGVVLVIRGDSCKTTIASFALRRNVVSDPDLDPGLTASDVSFLMKDILTRYARAFGSKAAFIGWVDTQTAEANSAYGASPDMPCPLVYTTVFTPPMMQVMNNFRVSREANGT